MVLNWADWLILAVIVISTMLSLWRGFVKEAIALATWFSAIVVAMVFYPGMSVLLEPVVHNPSVRLMIALFTLFILTMIIGTLLGTLVKRAVQKTGLSGVDRVLGTLFGFLRGCLIVTMAVGLIKWTGLMDQAEWWHSSFLIPHLALFEDWSRHFGQLLTM